MRLVTRFELGQTVESRSGNAVRGVLAYRVEAIKVDSTGVRYLLTPVTAPETEPRPLHWAAERDVVSTERGKS